MSSPSETSAGSGASLASRLEVGRVARPHGVRGELRVRLHWSGSESLLDAESIVLGLPTGERTYRIEQARRANRVVLLKLEGVDSVESADRLRGAAVCLSRAELPDLEDGEFYLCDLVGARVTAPSGEVGQVVEVVSHPSVDSLVIRTPGGDTVEQPLSQPWIARVDVATGVVELASSDGLIV